MSKIIISGYIEVNINHRLDPSYNAFSPKIDIGSVIFQIRYEFNYIENI